jgi:hypothetical protein
MGAVLVAVLAYLALATPAGADLYHNGRMVFSGRIDEGDPVNLLWFGGTNTEASCGNHKDANCVQRGFGYWGGMAVRFCNGSNSDHLSMLRTGGGSRIHPNSTTQVSGSMTCKTQYHARIWDDVAHGHATNVWDVSPIHHETRCWHCFGSGSHKIDKPWEIAEYDAMTGVAHAGLYCTYRDWRPLPGSGGHINPNRYQNGWSDGYITRMSFQQHRGRTCQGA